jgi:hypothetical protein
MGTSGPYTPSPKWSGIKTNLTNALNSGDVDGEKAKGLVGDFVQQLAGEGEEGFGEVPADFGHLSPEQAKDKLDALLAKLPVQQPRAAGGRSTIPSGGDSKGGGAGGGAGAARQSGSRSRRGGRAATGSAGGVVRPAAQRLAHFISEIPKVGLKQALVNAGVTDIDEMQPGQIALAVADVLATDASLLIMTELRDALATVLEKLCGDSKGIEEAEQKLTDSAAKLENVVQTLFECYIMERFKTFFCEHEAPKHGYDAADDILKEAREYISSEMELERADRHDLTAVDWNGAEGSKIVDAILERTVAIYRS